LLRLSFRASTLVFLLPETRGIDLIVYLVTNLINQKKYVGLTTQTLHNRWRKHCQPSNNTGLLCKAIKKYGKNNFTIEVLLQANSLVEMMETEASYIAELKTTDRKFGYNLLSGGEHSRHSEYTKQKISKANKGQGLGRKIPPEIVEKVVKSLIGRKHSEATKAKMRESRKKQIFSAESRKKISDSKKGRKQTQNQIDSRAQKNTGKKRSPEIRRKMSEAQQKRRANGT